MPQPIDFQARQYALDPTQSFIMQAPAGSGKTETLTQRYLKLLSCVNAPEEIIAITFTNKAATEMALRIYESLEMVQQQPEPTETHKKQTYQLAKAVLQRSEEKAWALMQNPKRMRVITIDAFCQYLSKRLILENANSLGGSVTENAEPLYQKTLENFIQETTSASPWHHSFTAVCHHLDNNIDELQKLLITMLKKREQWLQIAIEMHHQGDQSRADIEKNFATVIGYYLQNLNESVDFSDEVKATLVEIVNRYHQTDFEQLGTGITYLDLWLKIKDYLITTGGTWRKTLNKTSGLEKEDIDYIKNNILSIYADQGERIANAFASIASFSAHQFQSYEWKILKDIIDLAFICAGYLKQVFASEGQVDFNEVAIQAKESLGNEGQPTDLSLYLEHSIQHILIDEFQDTSILQFDLLKQLTAEWMPNDGHTLFLVGDPMQSIYRFRQAEVNLFLEVREYGIGNIKPINLNLCCNFRSDATIVDWCNQQFSHIFPSQDQPSFGAIKYSQATPFSTMQRDNAVEAHHFYNALDEADYICNHIQKHQMEHPQDSIAILARTRKQLKSIIKTLKQRNLEITEIDLDPLWSSPRIKALTAITFVMSNARDHYAWVSLLHSDLFGLSLDKISQILTHIDHGTLDVPSDGIAESKLYHFMDWAKKQALFTPRQPLPKRIEQAWLYLQGQQIFDDAHLNTLFYQTLNANLSQDLTVLLTPKLFLQQLQQRNMSSNQAHPIQLMTIHKSKGLEFDLVIIPQLDSKKQSNRSDIFNYETYRVERKKRQLMSPLKHFSEEKGVALYEVIKDIQNKRGHYENQRLLYVATTRAKKDLLLTKVADAIDKTNKGSFAEMLDIVWKVHQCNQTLMDANQALIPQIRPIKHFDIPTQDMLIPTVNIEEQAVQPLLSPLNYDALIGSVLHKMFEYAHLAPRQSFAHLFIQACHQYALPKKLRESTWAKFELAFELVKQRHPWIFENAQAEVKVNYQHKSQAQTIIIDCLIVREDQLWIVDYKFSQPHGDQEGFIQEEVVKYRPQLQFYRHTLSSTYRQPIRMGLLFPLIGEWIEVID